MMNAVTKNAGLAYPYIPTVFASAFFEEIISFNGMNEIANAKTPPSRMPATAPKTLHPMKTKRTPRANFATDSMTILTPKGLNIFLPCIIPLGIGRENAEKMTKPLKDKRRKFIFRRNDRGIDKTK